MFIIIDTISLILFIAVMIFLVYVVLNSIIDKLIWEWETEVNYQIANIRMNLKNMQEVVK